MISRRSFLGSGAAALALPLLRSGAASSVPWAQLSASLSGQLVLPGDASYGTARELDLLQFDTSPQGIAFCAGPADVSASLLFAQDNSLPLAIRSGGHSLGGYSTSPGLVIDVSRLNSVSLSGGSVTIGAGAENIDVLSALAPSGLAVVGGACPTVAAGGFIQGGGLGFLTPPLGMACDRLTSAQVVLASGSLVTASATEHRDLFWALRGGGGGNFGVVTSYTVTPAAISTVITSDLVFSPDSVQAMLAGYAQWLAGAPRTIGGAAVVTTASAGDGSPPVPMIILVSTGTADELTSQTSRLLALTGAPVAQSTATVPYQALMTGLFGCSALTVSQCHLDPAGQLPRAAFGAERSRFFSQPMSDSGWAQALAAFEASQPPGMTLQLQVLPTGGAVTDLSRKATAFVHRTSLYTTVFSAALLAGTATADQQAAGFAWVTGGFNAIDPQSNHETYQNFIDPQLPDWRSSYYAENYPRLVRVKQRFDPNRVFSFAQSID